MDICKYNDRNAENRVGGVVSDVVAGGCWAASEDAQGVEDVCFTVTEAGGGGAGWGNSSRKRSGVMHMRSRNG